MAPTAGHARDPELTELLKRVTPVAAQEVVWGGGTMPLRVRAFLSPAVLPDALVTSVRVLVQVRGSVVVCTTSEGDTHPWPGGRREQGETFEQTGAREVHEETGWLLDGGSFEVIGWLHFEHLTAVPEDHPFPNPDFLQVVCRATATDRDTAQGAAWSDTEGYEVEACVMDPADALRQLSSERIAIPFLQLLCDDIDRATNVRPG